MFLFTNTHNEINPSISMQISALYSQHTFTQVSTFTLHRSSWAKLR